MILGCLKGVLLPQSSSPTCKVALPMTGEALAQGGHEACGASVRLQLRLLLGVRRFRLDSVVMQGP